MTNLTLIGEVKKNDLAKVEVSFFVDLKVIGKTMPYLFLMTKVRCIADCIVPCEGWLTYILLMPICVIL